MTLSNIITEIHEHDDIVTEVHGGKRNELETMKKGLRYYNIYVFL